MIGRTLFLRTWLFICVPAVLMLSCKSAKVVAGGTVDDKLSARTVIRNHYRNQAEFKTLSGRVKIDFTDGESTHSFNVSLRMEKDKAIWISAPLGVVKAYITPNRVTFYNKLQNEYFDGDFTYLSQFLGTELDYDKVQNLLLGQALFDLREGKYSVITNESAYELKPREEEALFKIFYRVEPGNFKIASEQLSQPMRKRLLEIRYKNYQQEGNQILPSEIGIIAIETDKRNVIELAYRNMELNRSLSFPYEIPRGYDEILLK